MLAAACSSQVADPVCVTFPCGGTATLGSVEMPVIQGDNGQDWKYRLMHSGKEMSLCIKASAMVDSAERVAQVLGAGVRTVQLRIKTPERPDAVWRVQLSRAVRESIDACRMAGAKLFVNNHWQLAHELGAGGVHLGQQDLLAFGEAQRRSLAADGLAVGISSHSLWELCRARSPAPRYVACGPVWPTLTKAMPWRAQGLGNLAWWQRMAEAPVEAIGGILDARQVEAAALRRRRRLPGACARGRPGSQRRDVGRFVRRRSGCPCRGGGRLAAFDASERTRSLNEWCLLDLVPMATRRRHSLNANARVVRYFDGWTSFNQRRHSSRAGLWSS